mmetsp:Transcript_26936/g.60920  ORF Transcript_26936/g.60920 Transcript_26936/m.60920 type:complete len:217 (-) Transcript_26936:561-1211(-)
MIEYHSSASQSSRSTPASSSESDFKKSANRVRTSCINKNGVASNSISNNSSSSSPVDKRADFSLFITFALKNVVVVGSTPSPFITPISWFRRSSTRGSLAKSGKSRICCAGSKYQQPLWYTLSGSPVRGTSSSSETLSSHLIEIRSWPLMIPESFRIPPPCTFNCSTKKSTSPSNGTASSTASAITAMGLVLPSEFSSFPWINDPSPISPSGSILA